MTGVYVHVLVMCCMYLCLTPFSLKCELCARTVLSVPGPCGPSEAGEPGCFVEWFAHSGAPGVRWRSSPELVLLLVPPNLAGNRTRWARDLLGATCFVVGFRRRTGVRGVFGFFRCPAFGARDSGGFPCCASR